MSRIEGFARQLAGRSRWLALGVGGLLAFCAIALIVLKLAPDWFAETGDLDAKGRAEARQGVRTASLALLAGTIGVVGAVYTARSFGLNRAGQLTDRFTKAIEQLGHAELQVRLGGIYALERIARDSKEDHPQVVEVLTAYVRVHASRPASGAPAPEPDAPEPPEAVAKPDPDVQAAVTVLGRRTLAHEQDAAPALDLSSTELSRANLSRANLAGANLSRANLAGAGLFEANLARASLLGTMLARARLFSANLSGALLLRANLRGANLRGANLGGAKLRGARYDATTTWPAGFDPEAHGAQLHDGG